MSTFWPQPRLPNISGQPDFFQSHGYKDTVVPIKHGHKIAALLKDKGYFLQHCFEESLDHDISLETENNYRLFIKKILKKTENR
jgi:predicted esterase